MLRPAKRYSPTAPLCHSTKPGENKLGPSLAGVFGRKSGTEPGYNYSSALKAQNVLGMKQAWKPARACGTTRIMTSERLRKCGRNIRA